MRFPSNAEMEAFLPSQPGVWSEPLPHLNGGRQRWLDGAFGERTSIEDVFAWVQEESEFHEIDGIDGVWITITRAKVTETVDRAKLRYAAL